ncbi:molybdate ABC transporter permease subunit [Tessaracoccus sp. MC1865]|uniref:ABC transporter permease n=1 Tax=Tessaracoccus sp. MC1865 TaxID=2760310 RepID=UPI0015FF7AEC|nr:ABC transporter permease [Tessaracoccus sp. MC1865]MBB1483875.1 molybdate ABC transporter permease subunit [Tessaracoccus sp. MC1865]QTO36930.1 molybdate ABC transporter permease subunit [Tessaracoccus sp. MC1865]
MNVPRWAWLPFGVAVALLAVPLLALVIRAPWGRLPELLASERAMDALTLSLATCVVSTLIVLVIGTPTALVLARSRAAWARWVRTLVTVPMVLPPVVAGLALLITLGRRGLIGQHLSVLGIEIGFTTAAVIVAQTFVALPFLVVSLEGAFRAAGGDYERAAFYLGASPSRSFFTVTLPMLAPAVGSGTALAFARALGEFGATLTFAGSLQGVTRTLPLEIYLLREGDTDLALALAVVLLAVAALVVGLSHGLRSMHD